VNISDASITFDFSELTIEAPTYILPGSSVRVKADGLPYFDAAYSLYFYDSLSGYLGKDTSNFEGNAYLTYSPVGYAGQQAQMWVMRNLPNVDSVSVVNDMKNKRPVNYPVPPCSKKNVYFQNKPYAGPTAYFDTTNPMMYVPIYFQLDANSKAVREGTQATITLHSITAKAGDAISTLKVSGQSGIVSLPNRAPSNAGTVTFQVEVNDGTYNSDRTAVGIYRPICRYKGYSWTFQTGPGISVDPNGTIACGFDANGNVCPASVTPLGRYSYPLLQYTCL
jgi:hypothetical protein